MQDPADEPFEFTIHQRAGFIGKPPFGNRSVKQGADVAFELILERPHKFRQAGAETGDANASQKIDDVVYGQKD